MTRKPARKLSTLRRALIAAGLAAAMTSGLHEQAPQTVVYWYHFDNPEQTKVMDGLVAEFQAKNPTIKIDAQNIPWNNYYDRLFTAVAGGKSPDVAMVKLQQQAQLVEMGALEPIDPMVAAWPAKADLGDNLLEINKGHDGKQYYLPLQYVVIYLYYRADLFAKAGLQPPATCEAFVDAAKKLTVAAAANGGTPQCGFGMRGGRGGQDNWGPFVLSQVAMKPAELTTAKAVAANQFYVDLMRTHKVVPPSAPNDGFNEIINGFKSGQTAMIFHHIGSSKTMNDTLGDKVSAVPCRAGAGAGLRRQALDLVRRRGPRDVQGQLGQGRGLEVDGLHVGTRGQRQVRRRDRADDGDQERRRPGCLPAAIRQGHGRFTALRRDPAGRAADLGLRLQRLADEHAARTQW